MSWYSVSDIEHGKTTWVYELPSCDFTVIFKLMRKFARDNELTDCVVSVREYSAFEAREDGKSRALSEALEKSGKVKPSRKSTRPIPVMATEGPCWVSSFDWKVRDISKAKQINYLFYDKGWPGQIIVSKIASTMTPTEIVFSCHNRNAKLGKRFMEALETAEIPPDATLVAKRMACRT